MTIPPFPAQDLAKLVLGYLAEEQLMTAYDEFLQASPFLDALRNEYDRMFMTSLKNILAEYRALKIYVETCKPLSLRRRFFGCANLLEVVKFLIKNVDLNKLHEQETCIERVSSEILNSTNLSKAACEVCSPSKLASCACKSRPTGVSVQNIQSTKSMEATSDDSVETTVLEELPGNHVTVRKKQVKVLLKDSTALPQQVQDSAASRGSDQNSELSSNQQPNGKKHVQVPERDSTVSLSSSSCEQNVELDSKHQEDAISYSSMNQNVLNDNDQSQVTTIQDNSASHSALHPVKLQDPIECNQKIEEFNNILNIVCNKGSVADHRYNNNSSLENIGHRRESTAGTFQDFASGVNGVDGSTVVPDSSSEICNVRLPVPKQYTLIKNTQEFNPTYQKGIKKTHILFKVGSIKNDISQPNKEITDVEKVMHKTTFKSAGILRPKSTEQKVTILSDVKVDKPFNESNRVMMPQVLRNATSTPLMQMQTIVINGTPAYKQDMKVGKVCSYTKDEIMAMPTIILVPTSGPPHIPPAIHTQATTCRNTNPPTTTTMSRDRPLEPLVVDVSTKCPDGAGSANIATESMPPLNAQNDGSNEMLIKTVETRNSTVPKDNVDGSNKSTPHVLPPKRKSSSTPRRSSHVRVLDFATPRRILQETINEHGTEQNGSPVETIISKSPNLHAFVNTPRSENIDVTIDSSNTSACAKENHLANKAISSKFNWDADLRALAVANQQGDNMVKSKPKPRTKKKKNSLSDNKGHEADKVEKKKSNSRKKSTAKGKNVNEKVKCNEASEEPVSVAEETTVTIPVKPTINIIPGPDWGATQHKDKIDRSQNKSNNEETDTPEMDRISLQNDIGVKLNLSDLLETPYKQVLLDIQMETPKFLGQDLPDDPMSDIKIMNIPTPRFLNTPKLVQTPSSYSSRPTDYSSGGSYYKPDDQDYMRVDLDYPVTSVIEKSISTGVDPPTISESASEETSVRSSRPVRKCTKNVSYYNSPGINNKLKEVDKAEVASSCSETVSVCSGDNKVEKETEDSKSRRQNATEPKKKNISKKRKTPIKKDTAKTFMKLKPRRPTPTKVARTKRKTPESKSRKRMNSKDKHTGVTPVATCVPTKSRRKSSTPRKLPCTKTFHSESSGHDSPEMIAKKKQSIQEKNIQCAQDSDTEQLPLRWSDDGSQDAKLKEHVYSNPNDTEDITKIQEYIAKSEFSKPVTSESESNLHIDLVKRGFDIETARSIERDLLDTPPFSKNDSAESTAVELEMKKTEVTSEGTVQSEVKHMTKTTNLNIEEEEEENEEVEFSVHECNEDTDNFITCYHDDMKEDTRPKSPLAKLKDKYCIEMCIDDGVSIRLRATPFSVLFDQDPQDLETEIAVSSISNIEKLYTPMKDSIKAQCYEIFDSTLTSLDTPLKVTSPKRKDRDITVTEIVENVEIKEKNDVKDKIEIKKRKRIQSGNASDDSLNDSKRAKPEPQYLLNSTNIQNIDIETVLYKLHGP